MSESSFFYTDSNFQTTKVNSIAGNSEPVFNLTVKGSDGSEITNKGSSKFCAFIAQPVIEVADKTVITGTIGTDIYMYVLGENPYTLSVSGIGFLKSVCDNESKSESGFDQLMNFFEANRVSRSGKHCTVTLGSKVFKAYLTNFHIDTPSNSTSTVFRFSMTFVSILNKKAA